ncbi:MAG: hypothetical protein RQ899_09820 [Pseudomonadales bacterium]|nr:hypothetical protein [Pseudomonadales bacterium]
MSKDKKDEAENQKILKKRMDEFKKQLEEEGLIDAEDLDDAAGGNLCPNIGCNPGCDNDG